MAEAAAPIIVTAEMSTGDQAWADGLRRRYFPPERNQLSAHITLFHHLPPSVEAELRTMLADLTRNPKPSASVSRFYSLGRGVALKVESAALLGMRATIAEHFASCLTPQDRAEPRLHITIQNKVSPDAARQTLKELESLQLPGKLVISGLACWHYRGGPWSPIARYSFRG